MAQQYYYLVSGLTDLVFDDEKQATFIGPFLDYLREELHPSDARGLELFLAVNDNRNLLALLQKKDTHWITPANFTRDEFEIKLKNPEDLPGYLQTFLTAWRAEEPLYPQLSWDDQLATLFFEHAASYSHPFLQQWFQFEQDLRNVLAALNCRQHKLPVQRYLVGSNFITEQLQRSGAADFGLGREFPWVEQVVLVHGRGVLIEMESAIDKLRWAMADELTTFDYFGAGKIYAFFAKLLITERWFQLLPEKGAAVFSAFVEKLKASFVLDEEALK
jgi:hypothetical protein